MQGGNEGWQGELNLQRERVKSIRNFAGCSLTSFRLRPGATNDHYLDPATQTLHPKRETLNSEQPGAVQFVNPEP